MAFISILLMLLYILMLHGEIAAQDQTKNLISPGTELSPIAGHPSWRSPSGHFEFGFYQQGSGFAVGIWLQASADRKTVVWTDNRDDPPLTPNATVLFTEDGKLLLRTEQGNEKLIANTSSNYVASFALMSDTGNFILYNDVLDVVWESFEFPTDTILGGQILAAGARLFASVSETNSSTGRFHLEMQEDGNLVLYPTNAENLPRDAYWASNTEFPNPAVWKTPANASMRRHLRLNFSGILSIVDGNSFDHVLWSDDSFLSNTNTTKSTSTITTIYRATLDADGVFRLYSHMYGDQNGSVVLVWSALDNACQVKGFCGLNSYCVLDDNKQPSCVCQPGTEFADMNHKTFGCLRNYSIVGCTSNGKEVNITDYSLAKMDDLSFADFYPYLEEEMSMENCSKSCLEDCNCGVASYDGTFCSKQQLPLRYLRNISFIINVYYDTDKKTIFFKVGKIKSLNLTRHVDEQKVSKVVSVGWYKKYWCIALVILFSCTGFVISGFYMFRTRELRYVRLREQNGILGVTNEKLTLRVFSYNDLKRATNGFKHEIGKGGFGTVYKGALNKGREVVAVKMLKKPELDDNEREFRTELRTIGRTNHRNLVRLLGFCLEKSKRLLVYEYISNGSLADLIFNEAVRRPDWDERVRIAIDVARGVLYLHEECKDPIIHCDIKPQNILMDDSGTAKICDFGLAKLLMADQTRTLTRLRGTLGYVAPEWQKINNPISVKADVYSYGIVLMEIVCCRKMYDPVNVSDPEEIVLTSWVYKCFAARELHKLVTDDEEVNIKTFENMVKVGLWCIQDEPALRPSMKSVVLMLEGITDVSIPPCPTSAWL